MVIVVVAIVYVVYLIGLPCMRWLYSVLVSWSPYAVLYSITIGSYAVATIWSMLIFIPISIMMKFYFNILIECKINKYM